jgi:uncharacterized protein YbaR (Trm112 family)
MGHEELICRACGAEWSILEISAAAETAPGSLVCPACKSRSFGT